MSVKLPRKMIATVRLTERDHAAISARAAMEGKSLSQHIESLLLAENRRPLPTLAAAGALLAVCRTLLRTASEVGLHGEVRSRTCQQVKLVMEILRQHGPRGYGDDRK